MNKVLLAYEDYAEMMTIQSVLKKVGFDVMTTSNEFALSEMVLSFNPEIIIGYGKGAKLSTIGVGRRLREMPRWTGHVVLIFPAGVKTDPADLARVRMDMALEAPMEVTRLLQVLANYSGQDSRALVERMMKAVAQEGESRTTLTGPARDEAPVFVTGNKEAVESWNVKGGNDLEDFDRLMGVEESHEKVKISSSEPLGTGPTQISKSSSPVDSTGALVGGTLPPVPTFETNNNSEVTDTTKKGPSFVLQPTSPEKGEAEALLRAKVQGYQRYLDQLPPAQVQGHRLREVKKAQKDVSRDWPLQELDEQDQLRRDFTARLFKKKD